MNENLYVGPVVYITPVPHSISLSLPLGVIDGIWPVLHREGDRTKCRDCLPSQTLFEAHLVYGKLLATTCLDW